MVIHVAIDRRIGAMAFAHDDVVHIEKALGEGGPDQVAKRRRKCALRSLVVQGCLH